MEADWSVEIGADLPEIVVPWEGFVDLRTAPETVNAIEEAAIYRELRGALLILNAASSPVFTSKCDLWTLDAEDIDPLEFESDPASARVGMTSYIDVVARDARLFSSFAQHERCARLLVERLRQLDIRNGRADIVIRAASVEEEDGFALTIYAAGCGANAVNARPAWESVLHATIETAVSTLKGE